MARLRDSSPHRNAYNMPFAVDLQSLSDPKYLRELAAYIEDTQRGFDVKPDVWVNCESEVIVYYRTGGRCGKT